MFRPLRRKKQTLSHEQCIAVLERGTSGVFALCGEEYPYALPMSYLYHDGKIYFHCAKEGHKMDLLRSNPKVSFCVIDEDRLVPEEFTTYFRSVVLFGQARILEDQEEIREAITLFADRFAPLEKHRRDEAIEKDIGPMKMVEICIDHMTGKEAIELVRQR